MITRIRDALGRERGSIPLALLVVVIMSGLTSIVYARTVADQRSVRHDNEFTTAIHAAEGGVEEAAFRLNNHLVVGTSATGSGSAGDYHYAWTLVREAGQPWVVTSTGTGPAQVSRTVVAELADRPLFDNALATHLGVNFQGGNAADSYNSRTQVRCPGPSPACFGIVASNGNIDMGSSGGGSNYADRVHVHDWANPDNNGPQRCGPSNSIYCADPHTPQYRFNVDEPLNIRVAVPLVEDLLAKCTTFPNWKASDHVTGTGESAAATLTPTEPPQSDPRVGGDYYCFGSLLFDAKTVLPSTVTADDGLIIVVRDWIKVEGQVKVNCSACGGSFPAAPSMPAARRLQIFTLTDDEPAGGNNVLAAVQVRQHAKLGAAIYAPNASCGNQQSNAQVEIYGALICKSVLNQGGWQFHYDEDLLGGLTTGEYVVRHWREE